MGTLNLIEIFSILIIHFLADFVLQTHKQAQGKSKNWSDLLSHTLMYTMFWFIVPFFFAIYYINFNGPSARELGWSHMMIFFLPITFYFHTITDYFTSRLNSKLWAKVEYYKALKISDGNNQDYYDGRIGKSIHNFFVSIGFDQILHYVQLFTTYYLLKIY